MVAHGCGELKAEALAPGITQGGHVLQVRFGFLGKDGNGLAQFKELVLGVSHQLHKDATLAATAAAKGTHDLFELLLEVVGLAVQLGTPAETLLGNMVDEL
jgi:hypothetical protein